MAGLARFIRKRLEFVEQIQSIVARTINKGEGNLFITAIDQKTTWLP